jgi:hypothetical protein
MATTAGILDFVSVDYLTNACLGRLVRFVCGLLGVTGGRFLSMISAAAHSRWPLWQPSWIWFPSIICQTPGLTGPDFFCGLLGVTGGRFLLLTSAAAHSTWPSHLPSWISFPSIISRTPESTDPIFWYLIGGDCRKVPFDDKCCRSFKLVATGAIFDLVSVHYLTNASVDWLSTSRMDT